VIVVSAVNRDWPQMFVCYSTYDSWALRVGLEISLELDNQQLTRTVRLQN
jgi:hypothetical protein